MHPADNGSDPRKRLLSDDFRLPSQVHSQWSRNRIPITSGFLDTGNHCYSSCSSVWSNSFVFKCVTYLGKIITANCCGCQQSISNLQRFFSKLYSCLAIRKISNLQFSLSVKSSPDAALFMTPGIPVCTTDTRMQTPDRTRS